MDYALASTGFWVLAIYRIFRKPILAWLTPAHRAMLSRWAAAVTVVAWPAGQFTIFKNEPPATLALSFLAILVTALDLAATTDVRKTQE